MVVGDPCPLRGSIWKMVKLIWPPSGYQNHKMPSSPRFSTVSHPLSCLDTANGPRVWGRGRTAFPQDMPCVHFFLYSRATRGLDVRTIRSLNWTDAIGLSTWPEGPFSASKEAGHCERCLKFTSSHMYLRVLDRKRERATHLVKPIHLNLLKE